MRALALVVCLAAPGCKPSAVPTPAAAPTLAVAPPAQAACFGAPPRPALSPSPCALSTLREDVFFRADGVEFTSYYRFRPSGVYEIYDREHMGARRTDAGRWRETSPGQIELVSSEHVRRVGSRDLYVYVASADKIGTLPPLRAKIAAFLAKHGSRSFTREEVEDIERVPAADSTMGAISAGETSVPRAALEGLVRDIDAYVAATDQNHFHLSVIAYRDAVFLIEREGVLDRTPEGVAREMDKHPGEPVTYTHFAVARGVVEKELAQRQPFVVHTEMNECLPPPGKSPLTP
jgi:hypothetical protein